MSSNRGVAYIKPGVVEIQSIDYPKLELGARKCNHGVILKNHLDKYLRQRPAHGSWTNHCTRRPDPRPRNNGEIIETGSDVEFCPLATLSQSHSTLPAADAETVKLA